MHTVGEIFQLILAVGFGVASARLAYTAMAGRRSIRVFRLVGSVLTACWSVYYFVAGLGDADLSIMINAARSLQYMNLAMFLLWGFLFHYEAWEIEARVKLEELIEDGS